MSTRILRLNLSRLFWAVLLAIGSSLFVAAPVFATAPNVHATAPHVQKAPPRLTAQWWQSFLSVKASTHPLSRCDVGPGKVVFLAGTGGGRATRSCTISSDKKILVPMINVECSQIEGNGNTSHKLRSCAARFADRFTNLALVVDGVAVHGDLARFRVRSPVFRFTSVANNVFGVPPATQTRSVADGYWALLRPLSVGTHTVSFGGKYRPGHFVTAVKYTLTVRCGDLHR